ncbi:MAG: hypothetical protein A2487_06455 [Candidatus Raymondbacteria bacterium RifOxyC12_full_50_8]|nr:MAG: hypothetical protein A2248_21170 [Candidatus Raymondbacteria bacterium RIFOXYA2_FULL_49_16]OGJ95695.1 MAG: hypothetical protein A2350_12200 [Candidatus Raymondbacteria bacterium RifOxyB12_full_50_8]OGK05942.1 MAG: hypothetical protein A2487_06455 [Candidatus Raymondbacteria bacterium RifOxyC12_full_50_8]OGP40633.1 MAG: hypothetical protein A2324_03240 [Candidatus Raymondbacteria bacterium RIFOXYB2_FULL_49_35]
MNAQSLLNTEKKYLLGNYARPDDFIPVKGNGAWLWDINGKKYLDFVTGIAVNALGHQNPEVLRAMNDQAKKYMHVSNLYHNGLDAAAAKVLVENTCADRAFFCNSGTEANEAAIKFARRYCIRKYSKQKYEIITFNNAFHGRTYGALSATPQAKYQEDFGPMLAGFKYVDFNDVKGLEKAMSSRTCAVMLEFLQGEGGGYTAAKPFVQKIAALCKKHKALLIADEVQCGLGRTGLFMMHQAYGVKPEIITLAKPIGLGLPLGAVLMSEKIADQIKPGDHGTTFGGNPVALAVTQVILNKVANKKFLSTIRAKGDLLIKLLSSVKSDAIVAVRGKGLWVAIEMKDKAGDVINALRKNGLLTAKAGTQCIRFLPPLNVTEAEIRQAVKIVAKTVAQAG